MQLLIFNNKKYKCRTFIAMTKRRIILLHVLAWVVYLAYSIIGILLFDRTTGWGQPYKNYVLLQIVFVLSVASVFYYCYLLVLPGIVNKRARYFAIAGALLSPLVFVAVRYLLEWLLYSLVFKVHNYGDGISPGLYIFDNVYRALPAIVLSGVVWFIVHAYTQERKNKQLQEEKINAELILLRSQLHPQFIADTLNYIQKLSYPVSDNITHAIAKLSQYIIYSHTQTPNAFTGLQQEADHLQNYIDINRLLFNDNLYVNFKAEGNINGQQLPLLILTPLVENAFKHGITTDDQRPVRIHLKVVGNRLMFTVSNKVNSIPDNHLTNIRRRLELAYPGRYELLVSANGQTYKVTLNIEL